MMTFRWPRSPQHGDHIPLLQQSLSIAFDPVDIKMAFPLPSRKRKDEDTDGRAVRLAFECLAETTKNGGDTMFENKTANQSSISTREAEHPQSLEDRVSRM